MAASIAPPTTAAPAPATATTTATATTPSSSTPTTTKDESAPGGLNDQGTKDSEGHMSFQHNGSPVQIRNVWAHNVHQEMSLIRALLPTHPFVAMDTEFPGVVARPISEVYSTDYAYQSLKCNVDLLKIIQLGLAFADSDGKFAPNCPCWQFNFKFSLTDDIFAQDSIDLLVKSGISFHDHATRGILPSLFGELCMVSGLVLMDNVRWVSFHSGYDYGYLLKLLTMSDLPETEGEFLKLLSLYFPNIFDIKYMTSLLDGMFGGLQKTADDLGAKRIGPEHQAGSDALLTMSTYFKLANAKFVKEGKVEESRFRNELFGFGGNNTVRRNNNNKMVGVSKAAAIEED